MSKINAFFEVLQYSSPVWTGSQEVAFLRSKGGVGQLWNMNLNNGEMHQLTFNKEAIRMVQGYPNGDILYTIDAGGDENEQIHLIKAGEQVDRLLINCPDTAFHLGGFCDHQHNKLFYTSNQADKSVFDLYLYDLQTNTETLLYQNRDCLKIPCGSSPDGRYLLFNVLLGEYNNRLYIFDTTASQVRCVPNDELVSAETKPAWRPDSSGFYVITDRNCDFYSISYFDLTAWELQEIYRSNWDVEHLALSADGRYLAFALNVDGFSELHILDTKTNKRCPTCDLIKGVISHRDAIRWSPDTHKLLLQISAADTPGSIWIADLDEHTSQCITMDVLGELPKDLIQPEIGRFNTFDGVEVPYFLFVPHGMERINMPLLVDIHGGPEDQTRPEYTDYIQYYLSEGFAVAAPNVRGSMGYGRHYSSLDDREKRLDSVKDIDCLVEHLVSSGLADEKRIAVAGISYGGFMTLSSISCFPDIWTCAVDFVGIYNFVTFLEHTSGYRRTWRETEYGTLANDRQMLYDVSPVSRIENVVVPVMVIHGGNDPRVPITETEQMISTLHRKGNTVIYERYDDEGHVILKLKNKLDCYQKTCSFIKKYLSI